jgi:ribonuclease D
MPDSAIAVAAEGMPESPRALMALKGFHGRGARRHAARWIEALDRARALPADELPPRALKGEGPPQVRAWADRDPVAAARLVIARESLGALAAERSLPVENLLTPEFLRRVLWEPPKTRDPGDLIDLVAGRLAAYGARGWQIALTAPLITSAILDADATAGGARRGD